MSDMTPEDWAAEVRSMAAESRAQAALLRRAALVLANAASAVDVGEVLPSYGPDAVCPMPRDHELLLLAQFVVEEAP